METFETLFNKENEKQRPCTDLCICTSHYIERIFGESIRNQTSRSLLGNREVWIERT